MYGHRGGFGAHGGPGVLGVIFFVVLLALAIVAIVALVRMLRTPRPLIAAPAGPALARGEDSALAELRMRYARGDIERDDFLARMRDLGGVAPETQAPPPPAP